MVELNEENWENFIHTLNLNPLAKNLLQNCKLTKFSHFHLELQLDKEHQIFLNSFIEEDIKKAVSDYYEEKIKITFLTANNPLNDTPAKKKQIELENAKKEAYEALKQEVLLQKILKTFNIELELAHIIPNIKLD